MTEITKKYTECDVCKIPYFGENTCKKVSVKFEDTEFRFDGCYKCLYPSRSCLDILYKAIAGFIKRATNR